MNEIHISSLVIHILPANLSSAIEKFSQCENLEVCAADDTSGKVVALIETDSMWKIKAMMSEFERYSGVLSVAMIYHHVESHQSLQEAIA